MAITIGATSLWPSRLAYAAAGMFCLASGGTNLIYGWSSGADIPTSIIWAAVSLGVSIVFALSWPALIAALGRKQSTSQPHELRSSARVSFETTVARSRDYIQRNVTQAPDSGYDIWLIRTDVCHMMTASQLRAARALLGLDQQTLADLAGVSLPTIQRMEASQGNVRGVVDSLTKVIEALNREGVELIGDNARSDGGGRGIRFREPERALMSRPAASDKRKKGTIRERKR